MENIGTIEIGPSIIATTPIVSIIAQNPNNSIIIQDIDIVAFLGIKNNYGLTVQDSEPLTTRV